MIVVSRCFERIGDHAVDIGEQTYYYVTGEFREFTDASHPEGAGHRLVSLRTRWTSRSARTSARSRRSRATLRRRRSSPFAAAWDREHRFPAELFSKLGELGLMGVRVPEEYGGAGADFLSYILVLEELSRARRRCRRHGRGAHGRGDAADPRLRHPMSSARASCRR